MTQKTLPFLFAAVLLSLLWGCEKEPHNYYDGFGKKPVYIPISELQLIQNQSPKTIQQAGAIFLKDTLLFILEEGKGIHVFSLKDTANTVNLTFFNIPAISDFVITDNYLYADSWKDLVVINITDLYHIWEINRISNVVDPPLFPPMYDGFFECVDESKGAVAGWTDATLEDAKCYTN